MSVCVAAMAAAGLHAESTNSDQHFNLTVTSPARLLPTASTTTFWDRFTVSFAPRANEVFADRFHPFNTFNQNVDWANGTAQRALLKSVAYTVRKASLDLPAMIWLDEHQAFLGRLLGNSVDSVGEEAVSPLNPSYRAAEHQWWNEMSAAGDMRYGLRPLGANPYAFLTMNFKETGKVFLQAHMRYRFSNFSDHRFECALSAPLAHGVTLDVGSSYQFGRHDAEKKLVVKFLKEIKGGGIVHVGMEMQEHPTLFAGMAFAM